MIFIIVLLQSLNRRSLYRGFILYVYFGQAEENRSLYRGLRYIKVRYIEVPLYKGVPALQIMSLAAYARETNYSTLRKNVRKALSVQAFIYLQFLSVLFTFC